MGYKIEVTLSIGLCCAKTLIRLSLGKSQANPISGTGLSNFVPPQDDVAAFEVDILLSVCEHEASQANGGRRRPEKGEKAVGNGSGSC